MSILLHSRVRDLAIRVAGLSLLPLGALAIATLYRSAHSGPVHDATTLEFAEAASGFLCLSLGSLLLTLGSHIFDQVEVSARWASRNSGARQVTWIDPNELLARPSTGAGSRSGGSAMDPRSQG